MFIPDSALKARTPHTPTHTRLQGRKLIMIRVLWSLITLVVLGLVITGIPLRYERVKTADPNIRQPEFRDLIEAGVPPEIAATYDVGIGVIVFLALFGGGILMFWRGSDSPMTIFVSLALILLAASFSTFGTIHRTTDAPLSQPPAALLATLVVFLQTSFSFTLGFWLPDGRFVPRWTAGLVALIVIVCAALYSLVSFPKSHELVYMLGLPVTTLVVWAQVYRYRQSANPILRQQIKWAMVGIIALCLGILCWQTATLLLQNQVGLIPLIVGIIARILLNLSAVAVPVCFGIGILRYRLWDVDLTLNRSLVYGVVTVMLVLVFLGGGLLLQGVLGQANASAAFATSVISTGLLFNPARKRVQHFIDRRFYGLRFDLNELNKAQQPPEVKNPGALTGRTLGTYQVLGVIGKGGMGEVYKGQGDGRIVAIKILPDELAQQPDFVQRFEREAQTLARLNHPNIVKLHASGSSNGVYYMALEFVEGRELGQLIKQEGAIPVDDVRSLVHDFALALDYAHQQRLVHRDIKPSNIMVRLKPDNEMQEAVLMDFGIAKIQDIQTRLTGTGAIGTIDYMAPEQIMAAREVDYRADIYALGVVLYEMLTGERPFNGSPGQVLFAHLQQPAPDPRDVVESIPREMAHAVMKAMDKKPENRFQSAGEFAAAMG